LPSPCMSGGEQLPGTQPARAARHRPHRAKRCILRGFPAGWPFLAALARVYDRANRIFVRMLEKPP